MNVCPGDTTDSVASSALELPALKANYLYHYKWIIAFGVTTGLILYLCFCYISIRLNKSYEGFFIVKDAVTNKYIITDQLLVGDGVNILSSKSPHSNLFYKNSRLFAPCVGNGDELYCNWNPETGNGFVSNKFANGTALVTYLGRYLAENKQVHGLYIGGAAPEILEKGMNYLMNNSGMAYYNGRDWFHIWCSVNEGLTLSNGKIIYPSDWEFLGSEIETESRSNVVIRSRHRFIVDDKTLLMNRRMSFTAGAPYLNLEITITNAGIKPIKYAYIYGDEPWVGNYGNSLGDVGWVKGRVINYEEAIDPSKYSYVGIADLGNKVIGEGPSYSNLANFIEWHGEHAPDNIFFTNNISNINNKLEKNPLESNERTVLLEWDNHLEPGKSSTIKLSIGMAEFNRATKLPEKPATLWN